MENKNKQKIILPDRIFGKKVDGAMEEMLKEDKTSVIHPPIQANAPDTGIQSAKDSWRVLGVSYRNGIYSVDLAKQLLPARTQEEHAEHRNKAGKGEFYIADMLLYHTLFTALFKQKDKPESEEAREFIQKQMGGHWLMTLTRIAYQPTGDDLVIHNYNTKDRYEINASVVGPDRFIEARDSKALEALLGTGNISEINSVYNWISQTPAYIWRLNSKPIQVCERVARFLADSDGALLDCDGNPDFSDSSLGVRLVVRPKGVAKNSRSELK